MRRRSRHSRMFIIGMAFLAFIVGGLIISFSIRACVRHHTVLDGVGQLHKLHNRMIISNYYLVEASHKLAAFNEDKGTARQMLIPMTLFTESSLNGNSTPPLDAIDHTLTTFHKFSKSLLYFPESGHSTYLYAVNGKRMERFLSISNRLIK